MVAGIYYDLHVDYATWIWEEFLKSVGNTNVVDGISCAQYWSLILQFVYKKEGIQVPYGKDIAEFSMYHYPKTVENDIDVFPIVARILDAMLNKVDPTNHIFTAYLQTINPSIETGVLPP